MQCSKSVPKITHICDERNENFDLYFWGPFLHFLTQNCSCLVLRDPNYPLFEVTIEGSTQYVLVLGINSDTSTIEEIRGIAVQMQSTPLAVQMSVRFRSQTDQLSMQHP